MEGEQLAHIMNIKYSFRSDLLETLGGTRKNQCQLKLIYRVALQVLLLLLLPNQLSYLISSLFHDH